jgi:hypothetical protein
MPEVTAQPTPAAALLARLQGPHGQAERERISAALNKLPYFSVSPEQVANLARLAAYLRTLPDLYAGFHMGDYFQVGPTDLPDDPSYLSQMPAGNAQQISKEIPCGSTACAVGHGPAAGMPLLEQPNCRARQEGYDSIVEDWPAYESRVFGDGLYEALFEGGWAAVDNTTRGAAARICAVLADADNVARLTKYYDRDAQQAAVYEEFVA